MRGGETVASVKDWGLYAAALGLGLGLWLGQAWWWGDARCLWIRCALDPTAGP